MSKKKSRDFILFDQFRMVISYSCNNERDISVPVYSSDIDKKKSKKNIYDSTRFLKLNKIGYIQINIPKHILKKINVKKYNLKKDKIKILLPMNPSTYLNPDIYKSILIPFRIFKRLMQEYEYYLIRKNGEIPDDKLSYIFMFMSDNLKHAKVRDKDKKTLCYITLF